MEDLLHFFFMETNIFDANLDTGTVFREQYAQIQSQINKPRNQGGKRDTQDAQSQLAYKQECADNFDGAAGE